MSTVLTVGPPAPAGIAGRAGIPFGRLLRAELRKLTDTRAGKWLLIAIAAITVLVVVIALFTAPARNLTYSKLVGYTQTPQKLLLPVLGILAVTSEWSQRTGLVTFTLAPERGRVLLAEISFGLLLLISAAYYAQNLWTVLLTPVSALKRSAPWIDLNTARTPLDNHDMTATGWTGMRNH